MQGLMIGLCVWGASVSGLLLKAHVGPWPGTTHTPTWFDRLCGGGPDKTSGCQAVAASKFSAVDFDVPVLTHGEGGLSNQWMRVEVPVAFLGVAYFVVIGLWCTLAGVPATWRRGWSWLLLAVVTGGTCASVVLLFFMLFVLRVSCTWCLLVHAINGLLLVGVLFMRPWNAGVVQGPGEPPSARRSSQTTPLVPVGLPHFRIAALAVAAVPLLWLFYSAKLETRRQVAKLLPYKQFVDARSQDREFLLREYFAATRHADAELRGEPATTENGVPTLVLFNDFQCSHCSCFAGRWRKEFRPLWVGPLNVVYRHFPLDEQCNDAVTAGRHPEACRASRAAEAARVQGGDAAFHKMHRLLFAHTRNLGTPTYRDLAERIGLNADRLIRDMDDDHVRRIVADDVELGRALGVTGTPAAFLDGRRVPGICLNSGVFWEAIATEMDAGATTSLRTGVADASAAVVATRTPER